ncbi:hypothetical protein AB0K93_16910 [Streptomyces sp. NPDC052676]|uniref:hypothetical protein n=1 Tax=Streptomyces sp. NPDC052676 TaxID=3154953 RepID=UPI003432D332
MTKPAASKPEPDPSPQVQAWRAAQKARTAGTTDASPTTATRADAAETTYVPEGQGDVPWHRILDTRLNDALVARVNLSATPRS